MKKLILTLVAALALIGCTEQGMGKLYKYTIQNESGKPMIIKSYRSQFPDVAPIITNLALGEELTKTYQDGLPPSQYTFVNFFGDINEQRDSLRIIYDNSKIQVLTGECSESLSNPLNFCKYDGTEEIFTFTQQDYENAEDCNGDCD